MPRMNLLLWLLFASSCWTVLSTALADDIRASERVVSRLNVRATPSPDRFVSKAWSTIFPEGQVLRLAVWNLKKLGHGSIKDYGAIGTIIEQHFDVLGIVEVMQKGGGRPGYDALMLTLGPEWVGHVTATPRPNTNSGNAEYYAIAYRRKQARLCDGWDGLRYFRDGDGSKGNFDADRFAREPAYTCIAAVSDDGRVLSDFLFGVYHATWADGDEARIRSEVRHIDEVFEAMAADRTGERDLMIVGDFNLGSGPLSAIVSATDRIAGTGTTINSEGRRTANLYDHFLLFNPVESTELHSGHVLDVLGNDGKAYYQKISDHLPIVALWHISGDDDD